MQKNIFKNEYYITDGGLETTLIFHKGIQLPHFASFELVLHPEGQKILHSYFQPYVKLARENDLGFVFETPTWRANKDWGYLMGYSQDQLNFINRQAVQLIKEIASGLEKDHKVISGNIGPRGDGYNPTAIMTIEDARDYHAPQVNIFAEENVDVVTALTLNYIEEAVGIVQAAKAAKVPVVISFTLETDGKLPGGETLKEAIERTDELTDCYALHYMINCAHPEHFKTIFSDNGNWKSRIKGIRANASTKSHEELDNSETLDIGDKCQLAHNYVELKELLPSLMIFGGCCGTDHTHLEEIVSHLFLKTV